ncbi:gluconokinase [Paracoccus isoporae]|uniref:Gluconokinase n=1 Tax=Paracoccus isoporae TaxID=591205 RepID=A0A1G6TMW0_9RHOB|nr:gluconokinase [Paracoccus isoporae]SDD30400.1 gluconokinase [Paracoccus isoporae]
MGSTAGRFVIMGVSGCGKSTIGAAVAARLGLAFIDGDALHPDENIAKMARGIPLDDADRAPWLDRVGAALGPGALIACSALRRAYRDRIRANCDGPVTFLFLRGRRETLIRRMSDRDGHFMPAALLDSQIATLEPPTADERVVAADIEEDPARLVDRLLAGIAAMDGPGPPG